MGMFSPTGLTGISLHLFGWLLVPIALALLAGIAAWVLLARAAGGRARLRAARLPALITALAAGLVVLAATLPMTHAGLASLNGVLDVVLFLLPGLAVAVGAGLVAWPVFALCRSPAEAAGSIIANGEARAGGD